ncbi:carboxypeptidase-like regulatory domain-containing protein [Hymenobacter cellulosilyticus]|uniref:Carboxypeptidase-like regulatory domain-containing protein n=1 Tax=Hymenobacter cellulosilyticus TaxID=2932248 RepID=A0A8T9Q5Q7_9BACT|nr:carboxypeptidase-like regulatory domain-containing protein [Hymenobacter cellulosilyticus]UOQ72986.1 carboxypeptidase-like regulatory domain-containing protein [Hymenobacter cellulosilyticus]
MPQYSLRFILLLPALLATLTGRAQAITGTIRDANTHEPVPYVNIGVLHKGVGTVADEQGTYRLNLAEAQPTDTVRISSLGFRPRLLRVQELRQQPAVELSPEAVVLREVKVKAKGMYKRTRTLGFRNPDASGTLNMSSNDLGTEIGSVINLSRKPTRVINANFNVAYNHSGPLTFRVNIYRLLPNGRPSQEKLLRRDVIVTSGIEKGTITVDLTPDQLILDEDFMLALEWIKGPANAKVQSQLAFVAGLGYANNDFYLRETSQASWERTSVGAYLAGMQPKISFYVTAQD